MPIDDSSVPASPVRGGSPSSAAGDGEPIVGGVAPVVGRALVEKAADTTKDNPWPVRVLSEKIAQYIDRMVPLWIEGQVVQLNRRPGAGMAFLTIRDTDQDMSLPVSIYARSLESAGPLSEGAHVVARVKPTFWTKRGSFQLQASELAHVGLGELLARIEQLKQELAREGLFDGDRKQSLPFLPKTIGLICGRESEAMHDVVVNAQARWPGVSFEIREVAVQGVHAVSQVSAALVELDARADVEVIVIARGGGAVEDLLPFSNESLVRAVAAARTPVVSAIGHERDTPLLDLVADYRASTPTDAAKRIVPDVAEELLKVDHALARIRSVVGGFVDREREGLRLMRSRPVLAQPEVLIDAHRVDIERGRERLRGLVEGLVARRSGELGALHAKVAALSPLSTLERGYAIVQDAAGRVVTDEGSVAAGDRVSVRVLSGSFAAERTS
ncbi:exodeoxyribonuclease VII large subunit [Timonella sp. A28]|uniref:exodeoxyribonuclease VII large subunit n=1 Tax=Timonella sp. A28 TaxID=3442640 RepID=UPI003EBF7EC6